MSIVSKIAGIISGDYEVTCFTQPELESSFHDKKMVHEGRGRVDLSKDQKTNAHAKVPTYRNKLAQYIKGETDILCFSPSPEDCSDGVLWDGFVPNKSNDEDDLIFIDNGRGIRNRSDHRTPVLNGMAKVTSEESSTKTPRIINYNSSSKSDDLTVTPNVRLHYPELESSFHDKKMVHEVRGRVDLSKDQKTNAHAKVPTYRNKLAQYIKGETDILCFSPSPEDCSDGVLWDGFVPNKSNDEDDLIFIDNGRGIRSRSDHSTPMLNGMTKVTSEESSTKTPRIINYNSSSKSIYRTDGVGSHSNIRGNSSSGSFLTTSSTVSHPRSKYSSDPTQNYSPPDNQLTSGLTRSFVSEIHSQSYKNDNRPSPNNVTNVPCNTNQAIPIQGTESANDFLKALYEKDNKSFISNLLDTDETDSESVRRNIKLDFELAGFTPEESLTIKRRIKLQKLVRTLNADLSIR